MEPPSATHENTYSLFSNFVVPSSFGYPTVRREILDFVQPANQALILDILGHCQTAKTIPWNQHAQTLQGLRKICRESSLRWPLQLFSAVAFSALYAGQCKDSELPTIAEEIISDALDSTERLSLHFLEQFSSELRSKIERYVIIMLASYNNLHQLENPQKGFWNIFLLWKTGIGEMVNGDLKLHACLQFPNHYWTKIAPKEEPLLKQLVLKAKSSFEYRGGLKGFTDLQISFRDGYPEDWRWSERLVLLRQVGCLYMLGLHLNLWTGSIETVFSGYLRSFCSAASVYAEANKDVSGQIAFIERLITSCPRAFEENKVLYALQSYFLHVSTPKLSVEKSKLYNILMFYDLLAKHCPPESLPKFARVAAQPENN